MPRSDERDIIASYENLHLTFELLAPAMTASERKELSNSYV